MVDPNTRQGKRTPVTLKIKFKSETLEQFIERYAVDVSQGGIFIRTKEPLAVGTQMKFEFQLRDASPLIAGEGTVVWTRENDPSRPAIAPGMGVRFDRLADGSQNILERILTEKAKQAPQRPASDTAKPPMFTDTPTRVAPAPVQEALLGKDGRSRRSSDEPGNDSHTPLPKPMPFHSDADEFPDEAFEEATKVRALDELIAQTAEGGSNTPAAGSPPTSSAARADEDLVARRNGRLDTPVESAAERAETARAQEAQAEALPNPPEPSRPLPKLLDTSPSPRNEAANPAFVSESMSRTRLGVGIEPRPRSNTPGPLSGPGSGPGPGPGPMPSSFASEAPPLSSGVRAVPAETTEPARMPQATQNRSIAPIAILILLLIAAGGAAVWFFVIRPGQIQHNESGGGSASGATVASGQMPPVTPPAVPAVGSGAADVPAVGSGSGSAVPATTPPPANVPKAEVVDTVIAASEAGATIEISGTDQKGAAPFTAKLDKGKTYQAKISAKGFATMEMAVTGGSDKQTAKLVAKPRKIAVTSDPAGALLWVDNSSTGHTTPFEIELTTAQAAKKAVHVQLRKSGFRTIDRVVDLAKMTEDDTQLSAKLDEKLSVQPVAAPPPPHNPNPPADTGAVTHPGGGTDTPAPTGDTPAPTGDTPAPTTPPAPAPAPSAGSAEPEPNFNKGQ